MIQYRPLISVLIPCFNRESTIRRCVESALFQPYDNIEVIISDNASTDKTLEILTELQAQDNRIILLKNSINEGPYPNWLKCIHAASGDFVHWLWSDDWIEPTFYTDAVQRLINDKSQIVTTWNYRCDDGEERYISWRYSYPVECSKIAFQKVFAQTLELPVSPAAYLLPINSARTITSKIWKEKIISNCVQRGIGIDSVMILHALSSTKLLSVIQSPSVTFTKTSTNISSVEQLSGNLDRCYAMMHIYFLSQFRSPLTGRQFQYIYNGLRLFDPRNRLFILSEILKRNPRLVLAISIESLLRKLVNTTLILSSYISCLLLGKPVERESERAFFKS